jgi:hypothetical protein
MSSSSPYNHPRFLFMIFEAQLAELRGLEEN